MDKNEIVQNLTKELKTAKIIQDEPMKKRTTFRIGGTADVYVRAKEVEDVRTVLVFAKNHQIPVTIIGNGSNVLVRDKGIRGIVLYADLDQISFQEIEDGMLITVGAGCKLGGISMMCMERSLTGFEFAFGIPGSIGGAIRMNAGAHGGQMQDVVVSTTYMDFDGNVQTLTNEEQEFDYRESIFSKKHIGVILETKLKLSYGNQNEIKSKMKEYTAYRKEKQPISYPSAGSTFKRGDGFITAKLIDECGLKGYQIGGAKISDLHAGFIINEKEATAKDVLDLVKYTKQKVYEKFEKNIELEIEVIGEE